MDKPEKLIVNVNMAISRDVVERKKKTGRTWLMVLEAGIRALESGQYLPEVQGKEPRVKIKPDGRKPISKEITELKIQQEEQQRIAAEEAENDISDIQSMFQ